MQTQGEDDRTHAAGAEAIYSSFRKRRASGEDVRFEDLISEHGDLRAALEVLHSAFEAGEPTTEYVSLVERLDRRFGGGLPDAPTLPVLPEGTAGSPDAADRRPLLKHSGRSRYSEEGEIGRGGMGVIKRVVDKELDRCLAMKTLREDFDHVDTEFLARFLEEAQVTAQLDHPGIVPVHDLGLDEQGRVYFTMKLVNGRELSEIFRLAREGSEDWNLPRAVGVLVKVCQALAFAHQKGILHRDLKPQNVMVGDFGETYVMDWGLARAAGRRDLHDLRLRDEAGAAEEAGKPRGSSGAEVSPGVDDEPVSPIMTLDGTVIGTPAFMSPEQAAGRVDELDERADVYALGAMLYTLLAGRPPYVEMGRGATPREILERVRGGPPTPIERIDRQAPAELVAICEKAMSRSRDERYRSALDLEGDLQAFLDRRVVRAYESGAWAEFKKWVGRNRGLAAGFATTVLVLVVGLALFSVWQARKNTELLRLSDVQRLDDLIAKADSLWPCTPSKAAEMAKWIDAARKLHSRRDLHAKALAGLELLTRPAGGEGIRVESGEIRWQRETLAQLVARLDRFAGPDPVTARLTDMKERYDFASTIFERSITSHAEAWANAVASASEQGIALERIVGLVPLGPDPRSGLLEFAHLQTGVPPKRSPDDGTLQITEDTGLVFVLLPGGEFLMGASSKPGSSQFDKNALDNESPVHELELAPFLISKYEMTQGQWLCFTRTNPSKFGPGASWGGHVHDLRHPVENVSHGDCELTLSRLGLVLPTEAQWEYAARGGSTTAWWTGDKRETVLGAGNVADQSGGREDLWRHEDSFDDGYAAHAPVGSYRANPFGLCDTIGNVWEWVRDDYGYYDKASPRPRDGQRFPEGSVEVILRGGSFNVLLVSTRSARRYSWGPTNSDNDTGLRPALPLTPAPSN